MSQDTSSQDTSAFVLSEENLKAWQEIKNDYDKNIQIIKEYIYFKSDPCASINPAVNYLEKAIFPLLNKAMVIMFKKVVEENSFYHPKSTFNGIDFISEFLYNSNPKYSERQSNWTYIFDLDWVKNYLKENPRPFYPLGLIWSEEYAATIIQAWYRGCVVRKRSDVGELRQFWEEFKETEKKKKEEAVEISALKDEIKNVQQIMDLQEEDVNHEKMKEEEGNEQQENKEDEKEEIKLERPLIFDESEINPKIRWSLVKEIITEKVKKSFNTDSKNSETFSVETNSVGWLENDEQLDE